MQSTPQPITRPLRRLRHTCIQCQVQFCRQVPYRVKGDNHVVLAPGEGAPGGCTAQVLPQWVCPSWGCDVTLGPWDADVPQHKPQSQLTTMALDQVATCRYLFAMVRGRAPNHGLTVGGAA